MKKKLSNASLPYLLTRLWKSFSRRHQAQFLLVFVLMLVSALAQVFSLGAVVPFLSALVAPEFVFNHPVVKGVALAWGITSAEQLILPLTVIFAVAAVIAGAVQMLVLWASSRLAVVSGSELSIEVYRRTLYQPYQLHVGRNSSEIISGVINKVNQVVFGVSLPFLTLISSVVLLIAIMLALIAIDPLVASVTAVSFGACYALITWASRRHLSRNSKRIAYEQTQVVKAVQEGLGGIRDVLLDGSQPLYCEIYRQADQPLRRAQGINLFIGGSPRPSMEAVGIVLIAILSYVLSQGAGGIASTLPVLGAIAFSAQRLLPALQNMFASWASIYGNRTALADIIDLLDQPIEVEQLELPPAPILIQRTICLKNVRFRYTSDGPWVLDGLSLTIPGGTKVGFVGSTGSGKSTMFDILMGLLIPTQGDFLVDDKSINSKRVRAWQQTIAHVPQNIYLADTTLAQNIAFGVPLQAIDLDRVRHAAGEAQIADFIESLPKGYNAFVGEQGISLSGGQRQRIGIARALYKQASVLVFDEATSSLDNGTEQLVMQTINELSPDLTVLIIAHRLTTVQCCDIIVELDQGRVVATGSYEQLLESSPSFRKLAMVA